MVAAPDLLELGLRLGDSALVLSHRLSEWVGHAPALEEELGLANVALDLLGQGTFWLHWAARQEDAGRDADALAFARDAAGYRNVLLVEQPNGDFAVTLARQFYFDAWHRLYLEALGRSTIGEVAGVAQKSLKEVRYHLERSEQWLIRLGDGTEESHQRTQAAVDDLWMYTGELFEADELDGRLVAAGVAPAPPSLREPWMGRVEAVFEEACLTLPGDPWTQSGGRRGIHTEHLGYLLAEMQFLQRAYPGASW
ncbi:MAG: phenylacetate-CoA oxygenase subunit PaaC [Gammaproteobacteria bacterium]|nr:phenylacetate-CoA oxygenase subunit PaaC [Gammaproteobacteria bacterium]